MLSQSFILPRSIKWVTGIPGTFIVKIKLSCCSGSAALRKLKSILKRVHKKVWFLSSFLFESLWLSIMKELSRLFEIKNELFLLNQLCNWQLSNSSGSMNNFSEIGWYFLVRKVRKISVVFRNRQVKFDWELFG